MEVLQNFCGGLRSPDFSMILFAIPAIARLPMNEISLQVLKISVTCKLMKFHLQVMKISVNYK